ncbi:MAG: TonB family protein [Candidatus Nitrotoga sp.]|nr:TonB family protein [Candidatus Nitrotoga sp.]MDW7626073.1 TonB family protein [Candidatus Nitrotoga sp.]
MSAIVHAKTYRLRAGALAMAVHCAFFMLLYFGVSWRIQPPQGMVVDIWESLPNMDPPPEPVETPQQQAEQKKQSKIEAQKVLAEAERVRVERTNLATKMRNNLANLKKAEIEERQKRQEADEKQKKQKQEADEKQKRRDADARAVTAMGNEVAAYKAKIRAKILRNIVMSSDIPKDALAEFDVTLFSGGVVLNVKLVKSSGSAMYDRAVERAIKRSDPLPVPPEGLLSNQFRELRLNFSPNE